MINNNKISIETKNILINLNLTFSEFDDLQRMTGCFSAINDEYRVTHEDYKIKITHFLKEVESKYPNSNDKVTKAIALIRPSINTKGDYSG